MKQNLKENAMCFNIATIECSLFLKLFILFRKESKFHRMNTGEVYKVTRLCESKRTMISKQVTQSLEIQVSISATANLILVG